MEVPLDRVRPGVKRAKWRRFQWLISFAHFHDLRILVLMRLLFGLITRISVFVSSDATEAYDGKRNCETQA